MRHQAARDTTFVVCDVDSHGIAASIFLTHDIAFSQAESTYLSISVLLKP
jgi:hypothetical protein